MPQNGLGHGRRNPDHVGKERWMMEGEESLPGFMPMVSTEKCVKECREIKTMRNVQEVLRMQKAYKITDNPQTYVSHITN
jgi:hypothetical protein